MSSPAGAASVQNVFAPDTTAGLTQRLPPHGSVPRLHIVKDTRGGRDPLEDVRGTPPTEGPRHPGARQAHQRLCPAQPDPLRLPLPAPLDALVLVDARIDVAAVAGAHVAHLAPGQSRGRGTCGGGHVIGHAIGHATLPPVELSIAVAKAEDPSGPCSTSQPATRHPPPSTRRTS